MVSSTRPRAVERAQVAVGQNLASWRKLRRLTRVEVADRAGIGVATVMRLERGEGSTLENLLRVARALGVLEELTRSLDPYSTDVGRLRAEELLPERVRRRDS